MTFSRSHAGMIGIISIFTGMIAPVLGNSMGGYPFPLTDLQTLSYVLLFLLAFGFYIVSIQNWKVFRYTSMIIGICILYMLILSLQGSVESKTYGLVIDRFLWGWIFISIGILAILYASIPNANGYVSSDDSILSDTVIGIVGTLTLLGLSALIIVASINSSPQNSSQTILVKTLGSDMVGYSSGITMSKSYQNITNLIFDRKTDSLSFFVKGKDEITFYPDGIMYGGSNFSTEKIGKKHIVTSDDSTWIDNELLEGAPSVQLYKNALIITYPDVMKIMTATTTRSFSGISVHDRTLRVAEGTETLVWVSKVLSGYVIQKEGKDISNYYPEIIDLAISTGGYDTMSLVRTENNETVVVKNGIPIETIRKDYVSGSWKSNGSHNIYITKTNGINRVIYDGVSIGMEFGDIREIFLEKNGNGYAFFAQPLGTSTYCLYTRYRGTLCGLNGYMNPRIGADGASILYAGFRDGNWGIYRNINRIIQDTGYVSNDISGDYVFFDITNPKQYLFVERQSSGEYQLRKNGKLVPGLWKDVGLDTTFGYDNKIIMSVADDNGWRIIEL